MLEWKKLRPREQTIVVITALLLTAFITRILLTTFFPSRLEAFGNDMLGGYIDLRYGVIGASNNPKVGDWINVATFSLTAANQEIGAILEIYGTSRQTFALTLSNSASSALPPSLTQTTIAGNANAAFSNASIVRSTNSGLSSTYNLYLQVAKSNVVDVPIAWYLKGVSTSDTVSVSNVTTSVPPTGTVFPSVDSSQKSSTTGRYVRLETNSTANRCMQFGELQVYAGGANQSIGKVASASSVWNNGSFPPSNLVDGNAQTFAHTTCNDNPWMMVDLGIALPIFNIRLVNRADCCQQRAVGTVIKILDTNKNVVFTSDPIADKNGGLTYVQDTPNSSGAGSFMQYDIFPPASTILPSLPL